MSETVYRAAWVLPIETPPIRDGFVVVRDGRVVSLGAGKSTMTSPGHEIDLGRAILMPGFTNAHTHLELSNLAGAVPADRGFVGWIEEQLRVRAERPAEEIQPAIRRAIEFMESRGTVAVADVSNSLAAAPDLVKSSLHAVILHEVLGVDPAKASAVAENAAALRSRTAGAPPRVRVEVAAHAPHSLSRELFAALSAQQPIRSIHLAESASETEFLSTGGGDWRGFLDRRVGPVAFTTPGTSPVHFADSLGVLTPRTLAVHCVNVDDEDAALLAARGVVAVLCPRSNEYLGNGTPPVDRLLAAGVSIAFGTDSLASCASLDVLEDARAIAAKFPKIARPALLRALTAGGASALGFDDLGVIRDGVQAAFAVFDVAGAVPGDPVSFVLEEQVFARGLAA
jgi:aminodeoxyfutalosine deaminase